MITALALLALGSTNGIAFETFDFVIRGARVVDGTGNPGFHADVAVSKGRIARVGYVAGKGREELKAPGLILAPGFIDVHTHSENVLEIPKVENFLGLLVANAGRFTSVSIGALPSRRECIQLLRHPSPNAVGCLDT